MIVKQRKKRRGLDGLGRFGGSMDSDELLELYEGCTGT